MIPNAKQAKERSRMSAEIGHLMAKGRSLILQSAGPVAPEEASRLHEEAIAYLNQADIAREAFVARYPNALNMVAFG